MSRNVVKTGAAPKSANYSQAVRAGGLLFVSGQAGSPVDPPARQGAQLPVDMPGLRSIAAIAEV